MKSRVDMLLDSIELSKLPTSAVIARTLHISESQLRRVLAREGSSIRKILDERREKFAVAELRRGGSVSSVTLQLGYAETRSFRRAFKRWTGHPPARYRGLSL
ncbi:hypothetical protein CH300_04760 [Rhodococcus sp. 15-1154-1]|nr:hypothetical protein CH300_04760 [Rhodococcus sp. 15-1154-1]